MQVDIYGSKGGVGLSSSILAAIKVLKPIPSHQNPHEQWRMDPICEVVAATACEFLAFGCECRHTAEMGRWNYR